MGSHIFFRHDGGSSDAHSLLAAGDPAFVRPMGEAYFSGWTSMRQASTYGLGWMDCLSAGPEGPDEEWGPPGDCGPEEWYTPDWPRAVARVDRLLHAAQTQEGVEASRRAYDLTHLPAFVEAIHRCAAHPDAQNCQVRFSF